MAVPLSLEIYDKTFTQVGTVGAPKFVTVQLVHMAPGRLTFAVAATFKRMEALMAPGARLLVNDAQGNFVISGFVQRWRVTGPERQALVEFDVIDDLIVLQQILGWVVPTSPITGQGSAGTNWEMTGPAETVLKAALSANASRLSLPITVPASLGRGTATKARLRFQTLFDRLIPVEDGAGIIDSGIAIRMRQLGGTGLTLDVWEPKTVPQVLNEQSGVVRSWSYAHENPTATRVVVGGQGEGQLRLFRERIDATLETQYGWKRELFRDARDTNDPTTMYARADETLKENAAKTGFSVDFSETKNFRYGEKFLVGDTITLAVGGVTRTDRLSEVTLSWTADGGFVSRPRVGDRNDDPDKSLATWVRKIARSIRTRNSDL